jgi:hypothetical protein
MVQSQSNCLDFCENKINKAQLEQSDATVQLPKESLIALEA